MMFENKNVCEEIILRHLFSSQGVFTTFRRITKPRWIRASILSVTGLLGFRNEKYYRNNIMTECVQNIGY